MKPNLGGFPGGDCENPLVRIRPVPLVLLLLLVVGTETHLFQTSGDPNRSWGIVAGFLLALWVPIPLASAAWLAGGGDPTAVAVGGGPPIRTWVRNSGRILRVDALPISVVVAGFAARPTRSPRGPFIAATVYWAITGTAGAVLAATTSSGVAYGLGLCTACVAIVTLAASGPGTLVQGARSREEAIKRTTMTPVVLAAQRGDLDAILALTANLPAAPTHHADQTLLSIRAGALSDSCRHAESAALLRPAITADTKPCSLHATLASVLFEALQRGDVPPERHREVENEIRGLHALLGRRITNPHARHLLRAQLAYLNGEYAAAARGALTASRYVPPGNRGTLYAFASLAQARAGDPEAARRLLDRARNVGPETPMIEPAARALGVAV